MIPPNSLAWLLSLSLSRQLNQVTDTSCAFHARFCQLAAFFLVFPFLQDILGHNLVAARQGCHKAFWGITWWPLAIVQAMMDAPNSEGCRMYPSCSRHVPVFKIFISHFPRSSKQHTTQEQFTIAKKNTKINQQDESQLTVHRIVQCLYCYVTHSLLPLPVKSSQGKAVPAVEFPQE